MDKRIKVLYLPSWYPNKKNYKHGIYFRQQAELLNDYADMTVLHIGRLSLSDILKLNILRDSSCIKNGLKTYDYYYIDYLIKQYRSKLSLYQKKLFNAFEKLINETGMPDLIHAQATFPAGYGAYLLNKKYNIPFFVSEHASFFEKISEGHYAQQVKKILHNAAYYSAISSWVKDKISKKGREQCDIVPNFIDINKFRISGHEKNNLDKPFNLINISDIEYLKGIDLLLESLQKLIYEYRLENMHLHIIGAGISMRYYKKMATRLNVYQYCTFHGLKQYEEMIKILENGHMLVIASRTETFGIVGIEAMATGIPVVSTDCGGPIDYINDTNGIVVENENAGAIAEGIKNVYNNYHKYSSDTIRKFCHENYGASVVCKKIIDIYNKILNRN